LFLGLLGGLWVSPGWLLGRLLGALGRLLVAAEWLLGLCVSRGWLLGALGWLLVAAGCLVGGSWVAPGWFLAGLWF